MTQDDSTPEAPAAALPGRNRWLRALIPVFLLGAAGVLALLGMAATQAGLSAVARLVTTLTSGAVAIERAEGSLIGPLRIAELRISAPTLNVQAQDLVFDWQPRLLLHGMTAVSTLRAATLRVTLLPAPEPATAAALPQSLTIPLAVDIERIEVGRLVVERRGLPSGGKAAEVTPVTELSDVAARFGSDGRRHRLSRLLFGSPIGKLEAEAELDGERPFPLDAQVSLSGAADGNEYRVTAHANGNLEAFALDAVVDALDLKGQARIDVTPFAAVPLKRARIEAGEADPAALRPGLPRAALTLRADLQPREAAPAPHEGWGVAGPIEISNRTPGPIDRGLLPVRALKARAIWSAGKLELNEIDLAASGKGSARGAATYAGGRVELALDVRELNLVELVASLKPTRLSGKLRATISDAEQTLAADLRDPRFALVAEVKRRGEVIEIATARLTAGEAHLDASARVSLAGKQSFEVRARLVRFDPSLYAAVPRSRLSAEFDARGTFKPQPDADLRFALGESVVGGQALAGRGRLRLAPGRISESDIALDLAGNRLEVQGAFGRARDVLNLRLDAPKLDAIAAATPWTFSGQVRVEASLSGALDEPSGRVALSASELMAQGGLSLARLQANGELQDGLNGRFELRAELAGLRLKPQENVTVKSGQLEAEGTRGDHALRVRAAFAGNEEFVAQAQGALGQQMQWSGMLKTLALRGATPFAFSLVAPATLQASAQRIALGKAELRGTQARVRLAETLWSTQRIITRGDISNLTLGAAVREDGELTLRGDGLRLGGEWDVRLAEHVDGSVRVFRESGDFVIRGDAPVAFGLHEFELRANAVQDRLAASINLRGTQIGEVTGSATALARRTDGGWGMVRDAPLAASLRVSVPSLAWVGAIIDPNLQTAGSFEAEFSVTGTPGNPQSQGVISGHALAITLADEGLRLGEGILRADFGGDRLRLTELSFKSAARTRPREDRIDYAALAREPGQVRASGEMSLSSGEGEYRVKAERLLVLQRPDRWLMLSGDGTLATSWETLSLKARLAADAGYWELAKAGAPQLGDDVVVLGRQERGSARRVKMDLDVVADLGRQFYLSGQGLDTRLTGSVRLRGEGRDALRATGSIRTRGGTYDAYGQDLSIERGIVNFQGPIENPGLNILALRKNLPVEAGVSITGTALKPRVRLVSEPNVPDSEKLSWIVLGRAPDQVGGGDSRLLIGAANAILGGQSGGISRQLQRGLGLDEISVGTGDLSGRTSAAPLRTVAGSATPTGASTLNTQILTVGKRLSAAAYLSYEQSLSGANNVVKLTYNLTRRLSVIGRAGTVNAIDLFYTFSFN